MTPARVAIVIPTYCAGRFIEQTIASLNDTIGQSSHVALVHIADDASTDDTVARIRSYWKGSIPLDIRVQQQNVGEARNVNAAFLHVADMGIDWVILLHHDDLIHPLWPELVTSAIGSSPPECGLISTNNEYGSEPGSFLTWPRQNDSANSSRRWLPGTIEGLSRIWSKEWSWCLSGSAIKVSAFNSIGGFHPSLPSAGDNDLIVRYFVGGNGALLIPGGYIWKRSHANSTTSKIERNGAYAVGWAHLMHRYLWVTNKAERSLGFAKTCYAALRLALTAIKRGDWTMLRGQIFAFRISVQSWVALLLGTQWMNPRPVRTLLAHRFPYQDAQGLPPFGFLATDSSLSANA